MFQDLLSCQEFWDRLDSKEVRCLSKTCRDARQYARQYRADDFIPHLFGRRSINARISSYLNTIDYSNFRASCKFVYDDVPEHDNLHHLRKALDSLPTFRRRRLVFAEGRRALKIENNFYYDRQFKLSLEPGINDVNTRFRQYFDNPEWTAIDGIQFFIPAKQNLLARLTIGGQLILNYDIPARDEDWVLEDQFFNQPLNVNHELYGLFWHSLTIITNCFADVKMVHQNLIEPLPLEQVQVNNNDIPMLAFIARSNYCANDIRILRMLSGMAGWLMGH